MKKTMSFLIGLLVVCSLASAAPLTDYSQGQVSIDVNMRRNLDMENAYGNSFLSGTWTGQDGVNHNFDWGINVGLGHKFALQYNGYNPFTEQPDAQIGNISYGMDIQEVNLLYQLNKNLSVYAGNHRARYTRSDLPPGPHKNTCQFGLIGSKLIAQNTTLYGVVGGGSDVIKYEIGVSRAFAPHLEFNLNYRYDKVKRLDSTFGNWEDVSAKGLGYGLTLKF